MVTALSICEVTEACDINQVHLKVHDYIWVSTLVLEALEHIRLETGWDNVELRNILGHKVRHVHTCSASSEKLTEKQASFVMCG